MTEPTRADEAFEVSVLGPFTVRRSGVAIDIGGPKPTLLLALLVAQAGRVISFSSLIDGLWEDDPPATARKALQVHVSNLRRVLGEDFPLRTAGGGYLLGSPVRIDAVEFEAALTCARDRLRADPLEAVRTAEAALAKWKGPAYSGLADAAALRGSVEHLDEQRLQANSLAIDGRLRLGQHADVVAPLMSLTAEHPFREDFRRLHMLALYRSGRQTEALRVFDRTRAVLVEQLGVEPSGELAELHRLILEQAAELDPQLELFEHGVSRGFLAVEIADATELWQAEPDAMAAALDRYEQVVSEVISTSSGRVFRRTADGIVAAFDDAAAATRAAIRTQRAILGERWATRRPIRARVAVDEGPCFDRAGEFFGPVTGRVERLATTAHGGQIVATSAAAAAAASSRVDLGAVALHGIGDVAVVQLLADGLGSEFPPLDAGDAPPARNVTHGHAIRGYELREQLGEGAHAVVFRAYQSSIGREVALKVIRREHASRADFIKHFEAEAQFVAQLEHPHIVPLYDYWRDPDGAYLVMPWLRGRSLAAALENGPWEPPAAMRLLDQVGAALAYAHRHGVVHRDLKPANVLLDAEGNAYLSDFGIAARHLLPASGDEVISSAAYVSPEELAERAVGPESDIYGFALLANEVLTGTRPALGEQPEPVVATRPGLSPTIDSILERATRRDPAERYGRVDDVVRALRQVFGADVTTIDANRTSSADPEAGRNPYKGLRAFGETDAADFFGREQLVAQLVDHVDANRLTVVVGPSGTGKSSLVRAGLLPALRRRGLRDGRDVLITEMFPGAQPFEELATALRRISSSEVTDLVTELLADDHGLLQVAKQIAGDVETEVVIVIDQFEELFSLTRDDAVRRAFLDLLAAVCDDGRSVVRLVVTMRADFFDRPLAYASFGELMTHRLFAVAMPGPEELARAITEPARRAGIGVEAGLVPLITSDVADEPGALPLMQHTLTELVQQRAGRQLTIEAYERTGGVVGALGRRAESIFLGLPSEARSVARDVFVLLVAVDADSDDTRRRVRRTELDRRGFPASALDAVISDFGSFRLLSFDRDPVTRGQTIEVAHEALIREWQRLRGWIDERRESLVLERRLGVATAEWESSGRDPSFLFAGGQLDQHRLLARSDDVHLTQTELDFLAVSEDHARAAQQHERRRRRRVLTAVVSLAVVASLVAVVALVQRRRADESANAARAAVAEADSLRSAAEEAARDALDQRAIADDQAAAAEALRHDAERTALTERAKAAALTATALARTDPATATLVAIEAGRLAGGLDEELPEVRTALWESTRRNRQVDRLLVESPFFFVGRLAGVSDDGSRLVVVQDAFGTSTGDQPNPIELRDARTGQTVIELVDPGLTEAAVWDEPTGQIVSANEQGELTWWDATTGEVVRREQVAEEVLWHVATSDAHIVFSRLVDLETGRSIVTLVDREGVPIFEVPDALQAELSHDGRFSATFTMDSEVVVHDTSTGEEVLRYEHDLNPYRGVANIAWFADRNALWIMRLNGTLVQLDVETGELADPRPEQLIGVDPFAIDPSSDGRFIAVADGDSTVYIYEAESYAEVAVLDGHLRPVWAVEWIADDSRLMSMDEAGETVVWELTPQSASPLPFVGVPEFPTFHGQFGDDLVLLASRRGRGELWNAHTGERIERFGLRDEVQDLVTPANERAVVFAAPADDGIRVYDVEARRWSYEYQDPVIDNPIAFSSDGTLLVASTSTTRSTLDPSAPVATVFLDHEAGRTVHRIEGLQIRRADFSTDGSFMIGVGDRDGRPDGQAVFVVDTTTGEVVAERELDGPIDRVDLSPDDRFVALAMAAGDGRIRVLDVRALTQRPDEQPQVATTFISTGQAISGLTYSEDGSTLFTGDSNGTLIARDPLTLEQRWSISNNFVVTELRERNGLIHFAIESELSSGAGNGPYGLVAIPTGEAEFVEYAATTVSRELTAAECDEYLGGACPEPESK